MCCLQQTQFENSKIFELAADIICRGGESGDEREIIHSRPEKTQTYAKACATDIIVACRFSSQNQSRTSVVHPDMYQIQSQI